MILTGSLPLIWVDLGEGTRLNSIFFLCFSHLFSAITFLLLILVNCIRDESCREKLAPTSPSGSNIIDAAINSAHRCTL